MDVKVIAWDHSYDRDEAKLRPDHIANKLQLQANLQSSKFWLVWPGNQFFLRLENIRLIWFDAELISLLYLLSLKTWYS